jgi:hypothetical protein
MSSNPEGQMVASLKGQMGQMAYGLESQMAASLEGQMGQMASGLESQMAASLESQKAASLEEEIAAFRFRMGMNILTHRYQT